jgi:hypothetical protein
MAMLGRPEQGDEDRHGKDARERQDVGQQEHDPGGLPQGADGGKGAGAARRAAKRVAWSDGDCRRPGFR